MSSAVGEPVKTIRHRSKFPLGTTALLSKVRGKFPNSGTQRWMTVGLDGEVRFEEIEPGEYVLRVGGRIIPVEVKS